MPEQTPVLCLPGLQGSGAIFGPLAEALGTPYKARLCDLPPGAPSTAAGLLESALSTDSSGPWHVVAGSYGGLVALHLNPLLVRSLSLVATSPVPGALPGTFRWRAAAVGLLPGLLQARLYRTHLRRSLKQDEVSHSVADVVLDQAPTAPVLMERLKGAPAPRPPPHAGLPMLWLRGEQDSQVVWTDDFVRDHWPQARIVSVPGGHRPYASHPTETALALQEFWRWVEARETQT